MTHPGMQSLHLFSFHQTTMKCRTMKTTYIAAAVVGALMFATTGAQAQRKRQRGPVLNPRRASQRFGMPAQILPVGEVR